MTSIRVALATLTVLGGLEAGAHAMCGEPDWYGTPSGVTLPAQGTLYRHTGDGVTAVPYRASAELVVGEDGREARFPIDPAWQPPARAPRAVTVLRSTFAWTCSSQDAVAIQLDQPVAAVRVFWARDGRREETLVVPRPIDTATGVPAAVILLGKIDCAGENVPVEDLERGVVLALTAIRPDRSEVRVEGLPTLVDLDDLPLDKGYTRAVSLVAAPPALLVDAVPPVRRRGTSGALVLALLGGAIVVGARRGRAGATEPLIKVPRAKVR